MRKLIPPALVAVAAALGFALSPAPAATTQHLEYVLNDGSVTVYSLDEGFKQVEAFPLPPTSKGVRGVEVDPASHRMFVMYGGDGGGNGSGSVLAYDLVTKQIVWERALSSGIDSGALSADGTKLYVPSGELSSGGVWNILNTSDGSGAGTLTMPEASGPHNTVLSADGKVMILCPRNFAHIGVFSGGKLQERIGPFSSGVRPCTINSKDNRTFSAETGLTGFEVGSTEGSAPVLYKVNFGGTCGPSTCSHGVSLTPDDRELAVIDAADKTVRFWNVSGVASGTAPTELAKVPVAGLSGSEEGCAYDCVRDGWVQHTLDGRYVIVGDSGDVIESSTHRVVANLPAALNSRKTIEVDWSEGAPVATTQRTGVGRTSTAPTPVPVNSSPPTISGSPQQGQTLTETNGSWTNSPTSFTHQWLDCDAGGASCTAIPGATGTAYVLTASDVGHTVRVQEVAANAGGSGAAAQSAATATVTAAAYSPKVGDYVLYKPNGQKGYVTAVVPTGAVVAFSPPEGKVANEAAGELEPTK